MKTVIDSKNLAPCLAEIKANAGRYYVYVLSRPCGEPFYVGCGLARGNRHERIQDHAMYARTKKVTHKNNIIRSIWRAGLEVVYSIDSWHDSEASVFAREVELIAALGRRDRGGVLVNGNGGGTGQFNPSEAIRAKMRGPRGPMSLSVREEKARRMRDPEVRRALSLAANKQWNKAGARRERSVLSKKTWEDVGYREKMSAKHRARCSTPEAKAEFIKRLAPGRQDALRRSAEVRRADQTWKRKISATKRAAAQIKYELRDRCMAVAGEAVLPDHRASLAAWQQAAASLGLSVA